jgi:ADP-heptose:LPS heptosyltransferase
MYLSGKTFDSAILLQNGSIGDCLMAIFLAEMLHKSQCVPQVVIVVPRNRSFLTGLITEYPYISLVEVSRRRGWVQLAGLIGPQRLVILQPTPGKIPLKVKILAWVLSRKYGSELFGFEDKGHFCKTLYSRTLDYRTDKLYSENMQHIVRALGAPVLVHTPKLTITPSFEAINECGLHQRRYVVFHLCTSIPGRSFSLKGLRKLLAYVLEKSSEMHVVLSGGTADKSWIEEIRHGVQRQERIRTAIGYSARQIAGLIESAELYVGMDTGITHLACFLHARVIAAAHPGTAANWLPFYCPTAKVLYRLKEDHQVHQDRDYLDTQRRGRLKPFGILPIDAVCESVDEWLTPHANN